VRRSAKPLKDDSPHNIHMVNKQKLYTALYVILIVCVIIACIWLVMWLRSESAVCMVDPVQYFAEKTSQECYCMGDLYK